MDQMSLLYNMLIALRDQPLQRTIFELRDNLRLGKLILIELNQLKIAVSHLVGDIE